MRFAEYENWKSFTAVAPKTLLNLATAMRPGWLHVSWIFEAPASAPQPELPTAEGPKSQESPVYFNINVIDFVRLMSPRTLSSRKKVGCLIDFAQLVPQP